MSTISLPPTPLLRPRRPVADLRALVADVAADPARWHHLVPDGTPDERWYVRLSRDVDIEVWLLGWGVSHHTTLHDHGDSGGAFHVVAGTLIEERADDLGRRVRRAARAGTTVGIERGDVHDVANVGPADALSIHAYSPPLTSMTFYAVDDAGGRLTPQRTVPIDGPAEEPAR